MLENYKVGDKVDSKEFKIDSKPIIKGDTIYKRIIGKTYKENKYISLDDLVYIRLLHYNYSNEIVLGELIVNKLIEKDIEKVFKKLFDIKYQINSMRLIDDYWIEGSDMKTDRNSILHNNSSAFYFRNVGFRENISNHALGLAIDINPLDNPYTPRNKDGSFDTSALTDYEIEILKDREEKKKTNKHIITLNDDICKEFKSIDFECGGIWPTISDKYACDWQHFEPTDHKMKILKKSKS